MPSRVFVDADVLYSRTQRDWLCLLYLASESFFAVYWTEDILAETIARLRDAHPTWSGGTITRIRDRICETFEGGRVDDFQVDDSYAGADSDDRHVHAAAVECAAHILLTNDHGFLAGDVDPNTLPYEVHDPDSFFCLVDDGAPELVDQVTADQLTYWFERNGEADLPRALVDARCPQFAERVRARLQRMRTDFALA